MKREAIEPEFIICNSCRKSVPKTDYCILCGEKIVDKTTYGDSSDINSVSCPNCKKTIPKTEYCIYCGKNVNSSNEITENQKLVEPDISTCPLCRSEIPGDHNFCHLCGGKTKKKFIEIQKQQSMYCNRCWKANPPNIDYCIHCGLKQQISKSKLLEKPFEGYQMDLSQLFHPTAYPLSTIKQNITASSRTFPSKSIIIHSKYFGVYRSRKKTMNFVYRNFGGFDLNNLLNYSLTFFLMVFIYFFWYSERYRVLSQGTDVLIDSLLVLFFGGIVMTTLLMLPTFLSTFLVYRNTGYKLNYKLESSRVFTTMIFNFIWMIFGFGPIYLRLGEFRDPQERIVVNKSFVKGISIAAIIIVLSSSLLAFLSVLIVGIPGEFVGTLFNNSPLKGHIITSYLGSIWISIILLLPLGDYYDKVIKRWNQVVYFILLAAGLLLLLQSFSLMQFLTQTI
jgi:predicted amidophosphoribosyltransferase